MGLWEKLNEALILVAKAGNVMYILGLEGSFLLWVPSGGSKWLIIQVQFPNRPVQSTNQQKGFVWNYLNEKWCIELSG